MPEVRSWRRRCVVQWHRKPGGAHDRWADLRNACALAHSCCRVRRQSTSLPFVRRSKGRVERCTARFTTRCVPMRARRTWVRYGDPMEAAGHRTLRPRARQNVNVRVREPAAMTPHSSGLGSAEGIRAQPPMTAFSYPASTPRTCVQRSPLVRSPARMSSSWRNVATYPRQPLVAQDAMRWPMDCELCAAYEARVPWCD